MTIELAIYKLLLVKSIYLKYFKYIQNDNNKDFKMKLYTTLNQIRSHRPCSDGWEKLLKHLGKIQADDEPLSFATILESNGFDDAIWCLRTVAGYGREIRLYAVWCARQVEHLDPFGVAKQTNNVSERYAHGEATEDELKAARAAAMEAMEAMEAGAAWAAVWAAMEAMEAGAAWGAWATRAAWAIAKAAGEAGAAMEQEFIKRFCTEWE